MAYQQQNSFQILNLGDLIKFQLMIIGRTSANLAMIDEKQLQLGQNAQDIFMLAVRALDDMLAPCWDESYANTRTDIIKENNPHKLFQKAMLLIVRTGILINVIDIDVHDPDAKEWKEEDKAEKKAIEGEKKGADFFE